MLQLQYYNSCLKNNHIDKIIENYNIKYTTMKNEIEFKMNDMIKNFLTDILGFLENIEEIAEQKKKLSGFEHIKKELELTKTKLKDKTLTEQKLKSDFDAVKGENTLLKLKIKSLQAKISNLTKSPQNNKKIYINTKENVKISSFTPKNERSKISSPNNLHAKSTIENNYKDNRNNNSSSRIISNKLKQGSLCNSVDKTQLRMNYDKLVKERNKKKKKIDANKFVNNNNTKNNIKVNIKKINDLNFEISSDKNLPSSTKVSTHKKIFNFRNNNSNQSLNNNNYSPVDTANQSLEFQSNLILSNTEYEEMRNNMNNVLEEELKDLDEDEKYVKMLLEQIEMDGNNNE